MSRCEAFVGQRAYSRPGRCQIERNVKPVYINEGPERVRVKLCTTHRKITVGNRRIEVAR